MKIILLILFLSFSSFSVADGGGNEEMCKTLYRSATIMMTKRHEGIPLPVMISVWDGELDGIALPEDQLKMLQEITMEAYKVPRLDDEALITKSIEEFANMVALACYQKILE